MPRRVGQSKYADGGKKSMRGATRKRRKRVGYAKQSKKDKRSKP